MNPSDTSERRFLAFTLVEMLSVLGVMSLLMAIAIPNFIDLIPNRKAKIGEIFTFLEMARAEAMATRQDVYVCFATQGFPLDNYRYRAAALFKSATPAEGSKPLDTRELRQTEGWLMLPPDLMFGIGADFNPVRETILDSQNNRMFSFSIEGQLYKASLPYLLFNKTGRIEVPVSRNSEHLLALVDGYVEKTGQRILAKAASAQSGEFLVLNPQSGKICHLRE